MPDMDGFETTKNIRNIPECKTLPIIAMTAHAMSGDREISLAAGMNEHITKPIDPDVLQQTLRDWLNKDMIKKTTISHNRVDFPDHPDILDITLGLKHVIGNQKLLKKLLVEFHQDHRNDVVKLGELVDSDEIEKAGMLLHSLKGISANIGTHKLFNTVSKLENELAKGISSSSKEFIAFKEAFNEVMAILATM